LAANNRCAACKMRVRVCISDDGGELKIRIVVILIYLKQDSQPYCATSNAKNTKSLIEDNSLFVK